MAEKGSKIYFILEIYKVVILTIIALLLFLTFFDISIEKKVANPVTRELPSIDIETEADKLLSTNINQTDLIRKAKENRDELSQHCSIIATEAQRYFRTPKNNNGGGLSFDGFQLDGRFTATNYGAYSINLMNSKRIIVTGTGVETGNDGVNPVKVSCIVNPVVNEMKIEN